MAQTQSAGTSTGPATAATVVPGVYGPGMPARTGAVPHGGYPPAGPPDGRRSWTTPARLWLTLLATVLCVLLLAAVSASTVQGEVTSARQTSGPVEYRAVNVQELYYALADADAAAATGILDSPAPPARFTTRYQSDITQADDALAATAVDVAGDQKASAELQSLDEQLSMYTGLIGTAQADNRIGYPVGGAYLREASNLLENTMLPEVKVVLQHEISARSASASDSGGVTYWALGAGVLLLIVGVRAWRMLAQSTRRSVNTGLAVALLISAVLLGWTALASSKASSHAATASTDFQHVAAAQQARGDVAQISADEASSVVSEGADNGTAAGNGNGALADLSMQLSAVEQADPSLVSPDGALLGQITKAVHTIQADASNGDYQSATTAMVGTGSTDGGALVPLDQLAGALAASEHSFEAVYEKDSSAAAGAYPGGPWPLVVLGLLAAAAAGLGINRRIAEYR